jgi:hypothetical protein
MNCVSIAQVLPPKQPFPMKITQIHSGHSLTDPLFYPHWPGQFVNLMGMVNNQNPWELIDKSIGKSTIPGSPMIYRWENAPGNGSPDARHGIANWELLCITERVPLLYEGGSTQQWYLNGISEQREALSRFVNNAWNNGNGGKGAPTLLWTTWVNLDGSNGPFREMLDVQGLEWERMQDFANAKRLIGAPHVYLIPGHKMMARFYDDIQLGKVPGIHNLNELFSDQIHPNELGAYAIGMLHYACIYNKSPLGLPHDLLPNANASVQKPSKEFAEYVQSMVWDVVTNYERTGIRNPTSNVEENSYDILIIPNSAESIIEIPHYPDEIEVMIFDLHGRLILHTTDKYIEIGDFTSGVYSLQIGNKRSIFFKI